MYLYCTCICIVLSVFEFSLFTNEAQKAFTILNKNSFFFSTPQNPYGIREHLSCDYFIHVFTPPFFHLTASLLHSLYKPPTQPQTTYSPQKQEKRQKRRLRDLFFSMVIFTLIYTYSIYQTIDLALADWLIGQFRILTVGLDLA